MADWVNITDTALDPDAPLTSELAYAWRDNPIAIAEGAAGAPRVRPASLGVLAAGDVIRVRYDSEFTSTGSASYEFVMSQAGVVRISAEATAAGGQLVFIRSRQGVPVVTLGSWGTTGAYVARTIDASISVGDSLIVRASVSSGSVSLRNVRLSTSGAYIWPNGFDVE